MAELDPPVSERDHARGRKGAPLTLLEYGDYECRHCGQAYLVVKAIQEQLGERLCFAFRNFPLRDKHPHAQHAAEAAEVAGAQGRFWEMHDTLFEHQQALGDGDLVEYAVALKLDTIRFLRDMSEHVNAPRVHADVKSGRRNGVQRTPTFFINGVLHDGPWDEEALLAAIQGAGPCRTGGL